MAVSLPSNHTLSADEIELLASLRAAPPAKGATIVHSQTAGERIADRLKSVVGSWRFIVIQTVLLMIWIAANIWGLARRLGSLSVHLAQFGSVISGGIHCADNHDEPKPTSRYRSPQCRE